MSPFSSDRVFYMRRVLLCGKTIFISGLEAILGTVPDLDLQLVEPQPECIRNRIATWKPDVLIIDSESLKSHLSLALLKDFPDLKIIGLDNDDNSLVVFSSQASQGPTTSDLIKAIQGCKRA